MVDKRIVPDLRWIAQRFPIYVTDGYSGPLPNGEHVGCNNCHVKGSDHYNGLAVDIVPLNGARPLRRHLGRDHPPRPLGRAGAEPAAARPSAGSATTATPATAAATTSTSPGTTPRRRGSSSPNGSKSSRSAPLDGASERQPRPSPPPPKAARSQRPARRHLDGPHRRHLGPRGCRRLSPLAGVRAGLAASLGCGADARRRSAIALALACLAALVAAGCGSRDDSTPVACLEGAGAYLEALGAAPGEVELDGETPISDCLAENQQARRPGDASATALVDGGDRLNAEARAEPGGDANLRLGYLLGAAAARRRQHRRHPRRPDPPPHRRRPLRPDSRPLPPSSSPPTRGLRRRRSARLNTLAARQRLRWRHRP